MLGTARSNDTHTIHVPGEKVQKTYMSMSAIKISDDESLVCKRMFSGLFTSHVSDPKTSPKARR